MSFKSTCDSITEFFNQLYYKRLYTRNKAVWNKDFSGARAPGLLTEEDLNGIFTQLNKLETLLSTRLTKASVGNDDDEFAYRKQLAMATCHEVWLCLYNNFIMHYPDFSVPVGDEQLGAVDALKKLLGIVMLANTNNYNGRPGGDYKSLPKVRDALKDRLKKSKECLECLQQVKALTDDTKQARLLTFFSSNPGFCTEDNFNLVWEAAAFYRIDDEGYSDAFLMAFFLKVYKYYKVAENEAVTYLVKNSLSGFELPDGYTDVLLNFDVSTDDLDEKIEELVGRFKDGDEALNIRMSNFVVIYLEMHLSAEAVFPKVQTFVTKLKEELDGEKNEKLFRELDETVEQTREASEAAKARRLEAERLEAERADQQEADLAAVDYGGSSSDEDEDEDEDKDGVGPAPRKRLRTSVGDRSSTPESSGGGAGAGTGTFFAPQASTTGTATGEEVPQTQSRMTAR